MTTTDRPQLVQRYGDAELPATGRWSLHRTSFIGVSTGRERLQYLVSDGSLNVVAPPDQSTLVITAVLAQRWIRLTASTAKVDADGLGFSSWYLTGDADDGSTRHAIDLRLSYQGVRRRGDQAWAWFVGRAGPSTPPRRRFGWRSEATLVLDLLFNAPILPGESSRAALPVLVAAEAPAAANAARSPQESAITAGAGPRSFVPAC